MIEIFERIFHTPPTPPGDSNCKSITFPGSEIHTDFGTHIILNLMKSIFLDTQM